MMTLNKKRKSKKVVDNFSTADYHIDLLSGKKLYFLDPKPEDIDINDIIEGGSKIARFYGHCEFYSILEHMVRVSRAIRAANGTVEECLAGLLHDGSEPYIGDVHSKLKKLLPDYQKIEEKFMRAIAKRFNLNYRLFGTNNIVKKYDIILLLTEKRDLRGSVDCEKYREFNGEYLYALEDNIVPWSIEKAKNEFMKDFIELYYNK